MRYPANLLRAWPLLSDAPYEDVLATRTRPGERDELRIECKLYSGRVGVEEPRKLLGVVADEKATRGVLVGASGFTRAALEFAARNASLELLHGANLVVMANEHLGRDWPARLEWILRPTQSRDDRSNTA